jgi:hypothetical protein
MHLLRRLLLEVRVALLMVIWELSRRMSCRHAIACIFVS